MAGRPPRQPPLPQPGGKGAAETNFGRIHYRTAMYCKHPVPGCHVTLTDDLAGHATQAAQDPLRLNPAQERRFRSDDGSLRRLRSSLRIAGHVSCIYFLF